MYASKKPSMYRMTAIYLIIFIMTYGTLHVLYFMIPDQILREQIYPLGIINICSDIINLIAPGEKVIGQYNILQSSKASLEIVRGCDGVGSIMLIISAMVAFSASFKHKLIGLVTCMIFMYGLNLLRIIGLYFITAYQADWFTTVHTFIAPTLIIMLGCIFFAWWLTWSSSGYIAKATG